MEKIRNPKVLADGHQIRNKFKIQMDNAQNQALAAVSSLWTLNLRFVSGFGFRISDFGSSPANFEPRP
jgi:hypothetical protein